MITCVDAFKNINIVRQNNSTQISPCCLSPTQSVSVIDFEKDPYLTQVRTQWQQGQWPEACGACQQQEALGWTSRRQGSNQWYQDNDCFDTETVLTRIDYWTGDQCNLACVICGPDWSSGWKQELKLPIQQQRIIVNHTWTELDLTQLKFVHFNGGEPLLSKEHVKFLQTIPNKSQVHVSYNTNATVRASDDLLELWSHFKLVQLDFSIDDIEQRFEYQRYPARWSEVVENLKWFRDHAPHNCMFAVNTAVGVLNHDNMPALKTWLKNNFSSNRFGDPVEHRQQPVYGLFSLENMPAKSKEIKDFLDSCDERRKNSWRSVFSKLQDQLDSAK